MPFDYYDRLSKRAKRTYQKSDAIQTITLGDVGRLRPLVSGLRDALGEGRRAAVQSAAKQLSDELTRQLGIRPARIKVLSRRPLEPDGSELHGRCSWETDDGPPLIEVWMRTHHKLKVVAFKTFLRTLIHELCHHLDYELHGLDDTFHTEGFFKRESSLVRQLVPTADRRPDPEADRKPDPGADREPDRKADLKTDRKADPKPDPDPDPKPDPKAQLTLPW